MAKQLLSILFLLLAVIFSAGCNSGSTTEPEQAESFQLSSEPVSIEIKTGDTTGIEYFPNYSVDYTSLRQPGISLVELKYYYPVPQLYLVDREFIVLARDSFVVEIKNISSNYEWYVDMGDIDFGEVWINSEVCLLRTEKTFNYDSTSNYKYVFSAARGGKGYISFYEKDAQYGISNRSRGLLIGYTINPLDKIILNLDEVKWIYSRDPKSFSTVKVSIKGTSNAYRH